MTSIHDYMLPEDMADLAEAQRDREIADAIDSLKRQYDEAYNLWARSALGPGPTLVRQRERMGEIDAQIKELQAL